MEGDLPIAFCYGMVMLDEEKGNMFMISQEKST